MRSETTKEKRGALPPAVYEKQKPDDAVRVSFPAVQVDQAPLLSSEIHSNVSLRFVSDTNMLASGADFNQVEEHESNSDDSYIDVDSEALIIISQ